MTWCGFTAYQTEVHLITLCYSDGKNSAVDNWHDARFDLMQR